MRSPLISVIVPNFNHAAYLPQRLDSVFNQTFQDYEVILLDDCSTDHSSKILKKYADNFSDKVTHFIVSGQNSGNPFVQWKKGMELASGVYIWIAESDDFCEDYLLEKLYHALSSSPRAVIAAANLLQVDAAGNPILNRTRYSNADRSGEEVLEKDMIAGNYLWNASAVLFRKSAAQDVDWKRVAGYSYCGDWLFWSQLLQQGGLVTLRETLSYFRVHSQSVGSLEASRYRAFSEGLEIVQGILDSYRLSPLQRLLAYYAWWKRVKNAGLDTASGQQFLHETQNLFSIKAPGFWEPIFKLLQLFRPLKP